MCVIVYTAGMAYAHSANGQLTAQHRSQSDSNLLAPRPDINGLYDVKETSGSMDDMDAELHKRNKSFFYRLVRPWKWGRRFRRKGRQQGGGRCVCVCVCECPRLACVPACVCVCVLVRRASVCVNSVLFTACLFCAVTSLHAVLLGKLNL